MTVYPIVRNNKEHTTLLDARPSSKNPDNVACNFPFHPRDICHQ